jgi:hypothetical protein
MGGKSRATKEKDPAKARSSPARGPAPLGADHGDPPDAVRRFPEKVHETPGFGAAEALPRDLEGLIGAAAECLR